MEYVEPKASKQPHKRPAVRSGGKSKETKSKAVDVGVDIDVDIDALLKETRGHLDSLLTQPEVYAREHHPKPKSSTEDQEKLLEGILRKPKYSNTGPSHFLPRKPSISKVETKKPLNKEAPLVCRVSDKGVGVESEADPPPAPAVKHLVVERDPSQARLPPVYMTGTKNNNNNHRAVEGYTPRSEVDGGNDVVISSLADLMEKANMLPPNQDLKQDPKIIEAKLEFSVMSPQQFEEEKQEGDIDEDNEQQQQPTEVFQGRYDIFSDDDEDGSLGFLQRHEDDEDDDEYYSDTDEDIVEMPAPEPRAFIKLWEALTCWITPEAVALLETWQGGKTMEVSPDWVPIVDTSEIAASRCAGLMALINMNLKRSLNELDKPITVERVAKHRLADLLRTFSYSQAVARLDTRMWRAMTCVLLEMVLVDEADNDCLEPPASAKAVGISVEEYKYLTHKTFKSLAAGII